jgi:hypothetical protein
MVESFGDRLGTSCCSYRHNQYGTRLVLFLDREWLSADELPPSATKHANVPAPTVLSQRVSSPIPPEPPPPPIRSSSEGDVVPSVVDALGSLPTVISEGATSSSEGDDEQGSNKDVTSEKEVVKRVAGSNVRPLASEPRNHRRRILASRQPLSTVDRPYCAAYSLSKLRKRSPPGQVGGKPPPEMQIKAGDLLPLRELLIALSPSITLNGRHPTTFRTTVHEDNSGALSLANLEPGRGTPRSKHYAVKLHWFRSKLVSEGS